MRTIRNVKLDTRSARIRIAAGKITHWITLSPGCAIGYRRGAKSGIWIARFISADGTRRERKIGPADDVLEGDGVLAFSYQQAEDKARAWFQLAASQLRGEPVRSRRFTVGDAVEEYFGQCERRGVKALDRMQHTARTHIFPSLGSLEIEKLTRGRLERWLEDLGSSPARLRSKPGQPPKFRPAATTEDEKRARRSTANRILAILKASLNHAVLTGSTPGDSAWRWLKPFRSVDGVRVRFLNLEEQRRFVSSCEGQFRMLVQAALYSGCRYGELCRLHIEDFQPSSGTLFIGSTKNGKPRHVHLIDEAVSFFQSATLNRALGDHIFMRFSKNGIPVQWKKSEQHREMKAASKRAGIARLLFHELRHTYASTLIMAGVPLVVVAKQLGHSDTRMVEKHYGHLARNYVADTIRSAAPSLGILDSTSIDEHAQSTIVLQ